MSVSAVCFNCARGWSNGIAPNPTATWRVGECGVCRQVQPVTEPSELGGLKPDWAEPTAHHGETLNGGAVWRLREWERIFYENRAEFERRFCGGQLTAHIRWDSERVYFTPEHRGPDSMPLSVWLSFVEQCEARAARERG